MYESRTSNIPLRPRRWRPTIGYGSLGLRTPGVPFLRSAVHAHVGGQWDGPYDDVRFNQHNITFHGSMAATGLTPGSMLDFEPLELSYNTLLD